MEGILTVTSGYRVLQGHTKVEDERGWQPISFLLSIMYCTRGLNWLDAIDYYRSGARKTHKDTDNFLVTVEHGP
jgi:hypothetical protein